MKDNKVNSGLLEFSEDQKVFVALDAETSEVKKAVTIDGDGVETDIQGVQPSGKKEITSTAEVNVANYATAQVVDVDLVAGNIKKDVDILGVVGSYEPETPASDFSTAEVTIIGTNIPEGCRFEMVQLVDDDGLIYIAGGDVLYNGTAIYNAILYNGHAGFNTFVVSSGEITSGNFGISVTGDATVVAANIVTITGDCTITVTLAQ